MALFEHLAHKENVIDYLGKISTGLYRRAKTVLPETSAPKSLIERTMTCAQDLTDCAVYVRSGGTNNGGRQDLMGTDDVRRYLQNAIVVCEDIALHMATYPTGEKQGYKELMRHTRITSVLGQRAMLGGMPADDLFDRLAKTGNTKPMLKFSLGISNWTLRFSGGNLMTMLFPDSASEPTIPSGPRGSRPLGQPRNQ